MLGFLVCAMRCADGSSWLDSKGYTEAAGVVPRSDVFGLLKWYNVLMTRPEIIGLSKQSVASMTEPLEPLPIDGADASFGQGVLVRNLAKAKLVRSQSRGCWASTPYTRELS